MKKREMPLINFKGITGRFISLDLTANTYYADAVPYYNDGIYELTIRTADGYEVKINPIKQEDANKIITCLKCVRGKKVKCWRG